MSVFEPLRFVTSPAWIDYVWAIIGSQFVLGRLKWTLPIGLSVLAMVFFFTLPAIAAIQFTLVWAFATIALVAASAGFSAWRLVRAGPIMAPVTYVLTREAFAVESQVGKTQTDWSIWKHALELGGVIIVKSRYGAFHTIPTRQLSNEALNSLRTLLSETLRGRVRFDQQRARA